MKSLRLLSAFLFCACASALSAQVVVSGYEQTGFLAANDDDYTEGAVDLGFSINFGGTTYTQTYISNNGYITFGAGSGEYTPTLFDASYVANVEQTAYPIIAAFFSDVDTRYEQSGLTEWGVGSVDGHDAFVAKWPSVGEYYYEENTFSPNTFSLILVSRADIGTGDFDIYFNYGSMTWDHGEAVAGFHSASAENPLFFSVPGSGTEGAFLDGGANALSSASNTGSAGGLLLQARDGGFLEVAAIQAVPEPSTWALLGVGSAMLGLAWLRRRPA